MANRLHAKWIGNILRYFAGTTAIFDIDGANQCIDAKALKINGTSMTGTAAELNKLAGVVAGVASAVEAGGQPTTVSRWISGRPAMRPANLAPDALKCAD